MRKWLGLFTTVVLLASLLAMGSAGLAKEKTVITVTSWWDSESGGALDTFKKAFEAKNPDIQINYVRIPTQYATKLLTMIVGGDPPDVAMLAMDKVAQFASKGALTSLDAYMKNDYPLDDLWPALKGALQYKGTYYAVPRDCTTNVLYYNKKLFKEAKVPYPTSEWTWSDFLAAAKRLTKVDKNGIPIQYGFAFNTYADGWYSLALAAGAHMVNADATRSTMNTPEMVKTIQFLADLKNKYHVAPDTTAAKALGDPSDMFMAGKLAMMIEDVAASYGFKKVKDLDYDVAPIPLVTKGAKHGTRIWTNTWVLPKGAKHPEAAWRFLKFLGGPEGQKIASEQGLGIPAMRSIAHTKVFLDGVPEHKQVFLDSFAWGEPFPTFPAEQEFLAIFDRELEPVFNGQRSAAEACAAIDKEANATIFSK